MSAKVKSKKKQTPIPPAPPQVIWLSPMAADARPVAVPAAFWRTFASWIEGRDASIVDLFAPTLDPGKGDRVLKVLRDANLIGGQADRELRVFGQKSSLGSFRTVPADAARLMEFGRDALDATIGVLMLECPIRVGTAPVDPAADTPLPKKLSRVTDPAPETIALDDSAAVGESAKPVRLSQALYRTLGVVVSQYGGPDFVSFKGLSRGKSRQAAAALRQALTVRPTASTAPLFDEQNESKVNAVLRLFEKGGGFTVRELAAGRI